MSLEPPEKIRKLQTALQAKAKAAPSYRFYLLYDKVYRPDVLAHAYQVCKSNGGAPGVDGQNFADIEAYGLERWLGERAQELRDKTYQPEAVRRVWIPKPDGKQRPLGIPTIRDRVVQTAALLVLEPIFETDMQPEQYAYRAQRSALDAVNHVRWLLDSGYRQVVDADLSGYFDSIPHTELMNSVARRISDRHVLHLIKMWLEQPVEETDGRGRKVRTTRNRDEHRGTPQGAPISPLLANLYMRRFVVGLKVLTGGGPCGKARGRVRESNATNPPVRSDERDVETEQGWRIRAPRTERVGNTLPPTLNHFATSRLHLGRARLLWHRLVPPCRATLDLPVSLAHARVASASA